MVTPRLCAVLFGSVVVFGSCQPIEPPTEPSAGAGTDQGWDYATAQSWSHIDQGTAFFPYEWFVALEQVQGEERFAAPGHMRQFGFIPNPPHDVYNPDGLPVGFSRTSLQLEQGPYRCWQGNWVGLTCAACHTGQVNYHGTAIRIEGGPAQNDIETFRLRLAEALGATAADSAKAQRFAGRVLQAVGDPSRDLTASLQCFAQASAARNRLVAEALARADEQPTDAGYARLDALGRGANFLFAESIGVIDNYEPTTAPVSFPALWDTPYFDWVLYNNSVRQPLSRTVVEALGVGAPIDLTTVSEPVLQHGLQMDNLVDIQLWLLELQSPKWPEPILGPIDQDLADRGQAIYEAQCSGCHERIDREAPRGPEELIKIKSHPIEAVGTDPRQAVDFATREVALGGTRQPLGHWVQLVTDKVVGQYTADPKNTERAARINRGQPNQFQVIQEYRARPLNGIWATAPYLHNGSVPDLVELLKPPAERVQTFYVGNWEFVPERVGFEWKSPFAGAFLFDTSLPGNSNAGHVYGTQLSEADRMALIEYLKTL